MEFTKQQNILIEDLKALGIKDNRVLNAINTVPRHMFVPSILKNIAYENVSIPIGHNQTISQPYIVAFMCEAAQIKPSDTILEIGTGSGYQAAILAHLCQHVFSIEKIPELGNYAFQKIREIGYRNITIDIGTGFKKHRSRKKFDVIIAAAAPNEIPEILISQLKINGRLIIPAGVQHNQELFRLIKTKHGLVKESFFKVNFVPMTD